MQPSVPGAFTKAESSFCTIHSLSGKMSLEAGISEKGLWYRIEMKRKTAFSPYGDMAEFLMDTA